MTFRDYLTTLTGHRTLTLTLALTLTLTLTLDYLTTLTGHRVLIVRENISDSTGFVDEVSVCQLGEFDLKTYKSID